MSVQTIANRWVEQGQSQTGIKSILYSGFTELTNGPGYCNKDISTTTGLPGQSASANQIFVSKEPYGPANCNQYATLIKPGVNPLTLRGTTNTGIIQPVNDSPICLESCDYISPLGPAHQICSSNCIRSTEYCVGDECNNNAPGGLADWMGRPNDGGNSGTWGSAINKQLAGGKDGYLNPVRLVSEDLMKNGFITQGCECQSGTSRIAGGTFYDWAQLGAGTGPFTLNTDSGISSEVWNGQGSCNTWQNYNSSDIRNSTCNLNIQKYAQTCAWCKTAVLTIPSTQPDQTYPPELTIDNRNILGTGTVTTNSTYCTFSQDANHQYTVDNGDCLGIGVNGQIRIPCNHPLVPNLDCPVVTPSKQKIGLFCNVPAKYRLTGESCGFIQAQDIQYMSIAVGSITNNYWVSYSNGNFNVTLSGNTNTPRSVSGTIGPQNITGGRQIAITFPNGTSGSALLNYLQGQSILTNEIDVTLSPAVGASLNNLQNSIPPQISTTFNTSFYNKITTIGLLQYQYTDSSSGGICNCNGIRSVTSSSLSCNGNNCKWIAGTGSYNDGNIVINYSTGNLGVTFSGSWNSRNQTNIVNITFPNGYDGTSLVNYINSQFALGPTQARNLVVSIYIGNSGPQISSYQIFYYGFGQGGDSKTGGIIDTGNCNINLDGSKFTGTWLPGQNYTDPSSGISEPWIGKQGIKCDYFPNQGSCQTMFYDPNLTDDCQICDSDLWDWVPGGVEAAIDPNNVLHNIAITSYIPKFQNLQNSATCNQTNGGFGTTSHSVDYCGKDSGNNSCSVVCGQGCVQMSWDTSLIANSSVVDNLVIETGGINVNIPGENCPDMLCERNPVLTLRGTSEIENNQLAINWLNGIFDITTLHGKDTGIPNPIIADPRAHGQPDKLKERAIKAMRCCLGVNPGFKSSDGGTDGSSKTGPDKDPYGGLEIWDLHDCPPGVMCPSSDTCKTLFKSIMNGTNEHITMDLNDFGSASYPKDFSLDSNNSGSISQEVLSNPAYYAKAYCELMSGGATKTLSTVMGLDDEINTLCRKAMYNYCLSPVEVDVISDGNYWNASLGATTQPINNSNYSKSTYQLPLNIFSQGCNMWFKNELQNVMPSDYGTRDMLLGSACQRLQVDGWYNPVGPDQSPLLQAFVAKDGTIKDKSGRILDLSYIGSANSTSGDGSIPGLLANTCNCFLLGSKCQGGSGSNCSYQYCGAGVNNEVTIDYGNPATNISPLNTPVDLTPFTDKLGSNNKPLGDSSWTRYQDTTAPSWKTGLDTTNFTCASGSAPQGMTIVGDEAGGSGNCHTACNYVNEYDVCWNASPENRKYSGELLGGSTEWNCNFGDSFENINTCDPNKGTSYSCFGDCEHGINKNDGTSFPSCGTQSWFDSNLGLNPAEIKIKKNRSVDRSDIMDVPYWQNFYSGASEQVSSVTIPNIGSVYNPSRSILASDPVCSTTGIKPYNLQFAVENQCVISQSISSNNQGVIVGSVGISQLGSCNTSDIFQGHDKIAFLTYMGANDCTGKDTICWNNNNFCLTDGTTSNVDGIQAGENCMHCGTDDKSLVSSSTKSTTCCLDPSLSSDKNYGIANENILNDVTLGNTKIVSYFCATNSCPNGSTDLSVLETTCGTNFTCQGTTDQTTCEGCNYCKWLPNSTKGPCVAVCPTAPQNGWNGSTIPTTIPTSKPTASPDTGKTTKVVTSLSNLSNTDIALIVVGVIIGVAFFINLFFALRKNPSLQKNVFGKIKRRN
jgi:hypothetical protein